MILFQQIACFQNIHRAYLGARKCKRYRASVLRFGCCLEENLLALRRELLNKTYRHGGYREFMVMDSKKRFIKAPLFRDRVVHHAICNIIEPNFEKSFIYDSYACRKGKGTHGAIIRLEKFIKALSPCPRERDETGRQTPLDNHATRHLTGQVYCLKCDISKYFDNVSHEILLELLKKKIKDENILWLLREIISSNPRGIPIGNLTSQLFANIYLNKFDHFIKRVLRERYYIRYMDDFLILSDNKNRLREDKEKIKKFLAERLKLELHPKKAEIFPIDRGIDFLGYVVKDGYRLLRKSTVKRFIKKRRRYKVMAKNGKRTEQELKGFCDSWRGYASFANSYKLMEKFEIGG